jgi:hypothetical protein
MYHYSPSLIGRQEDASYSTQEIPEYEDNPYIGALPPIFEDKQVIARIAKYPKYHEEQRNLGKQTRLHLVQQIADYVEPLPSHLLVEQRLSRLIRHGYKARNPFSPELNRIYNIGWKEVLEAGTDKNGVNLAGIRSTASGFAILGVSGQGKTTAIESSLLLYPQVIQHIEYNGQPFIRKQLVWLKLNCPFDGSLKGLCFNFFQAIDAHLGTNYFKKFASKSSSIDILIPVMAHLATLHGLGVLVIDEIQNLSFLKSGGAEKMLNYFTQLINTIGVPVVLIGTFKAMRLFQGSFSQARRSSGQGDLIMDRLTETEEWDYFLEGLWKYQWTAKPNNLTEPLKRTMYELSQGIVDIAVKLYMLAQWEAMEAEETKNEKITVGLLRSVAKRHMQLVQPLLKALRRNAPGLHAVVDDLYPEWDILDNYLKKAEEKVNIQGVMKTKFTRSDKVEQDQELYIELVKTAIDFGANSELAEQLVQRLMESSEMDMDIVAMRKHVVSEITALMNKTNTDNDEKHYEKPRPNRKKPDKALLSDDDLRNASHKDSQVNYEKLLDMGSIPSSDDISKLIV